MDRNRIHHDRKVRAADFDLSDEVWVLNTARKPGRCPKLERKWKGPYIILEKIESSLYKLKLKNGTRKRCIVINVSRLRKCSYR